MKVNRKNYWWHSFKMKWLVPNYSRAVGPAFWIYKLKEWWWYNMNADNCCGLLHKVIEWKDCKLMKWLTPQLKNARKFLEFCREENGTKLLWYKANFFRCRTRDENQYYFNCWTNWLGKVTVTRTQWLDEDGKAVNTFIWGIASLDDENLKPPTEHKEKIFSEWVLTKKQLNKAKEKILKHGEFGWDMLNIHVTELAEEVGIQNEDDRWKWGMMLKSATLKKWWPGIEHICDLNEVEYKKFEDMICSMSLDEALKLMNSLC